MKNNKYDLIVIGGGAGGLSIASGAARFGLKVLLIENDKMGGDCLWTGCVPSKTFLHEAEKMRTFKENELEVDKEKYFKIVQNRIKEVQNKIFQNDSKEAFEKKGVDVCIGTAKFLSKNEIEVQEVGGDKKNFKFKKCAIATGSHPFIPPVFEKMKVYTSDTIWNMENLPKSLAVIGGGPQGIEIATAFASFGVPVYILQREEKLMFKEELSVGEFLQKTLENLNIKVYTNAEVKNVGIENGEYKINFIRTAEKEVESLDCAEIFLSAGRLPNVNLDLEKAEVKYTNRSIEINEFLETSTKNIYAIGDVNGKLPFTHAAGYQARAALQNMLIPRWVNFIYKIFGKNLKKNFSPNAFPWVTYTYPEVAHVGKYKKDLENEKIFFEEFTTKLESVDRALTSKTHEDGFIQVLVGKKGKILGVTIVSPFAGELITEWVLAIENNLRVEKIYETVHAYPTLSELNVRGTFEYMGRKVNKLNSFFAKILFKI
jgi:pyruvate/2-oxoglutarate dehydrogenase complex dihydrolipoamide dehydrogenase (E3) component